MLPPDGKKIYCNITLERATLIFGYFHVGIGVTYILGCLLKIIWFIQTSEGSRAGEDLMGILYGIVFIFYAARLIPQVRNWIFCNMKNYFILAAVMPFVILFLNTTVAAYFKSFPDHLKVAILLTFIFIFIIEIFFYTVIFNDYKNRRDMLLKSCYYIPVKPDMCVIKLPQKC